ncbi:MAG: type VI secretion system Vgr family protein [Planctomycetaceae bacterium]
MSSSPAITMSAEGLEGLQPGRILIREAVSRPFRADVEFQSSGPEIDLAALLGQHVTLTFELQTDGGVRTFDGLVSRAALIGADRGNSVYRARLRPWSWFLKQFSDCRIFQNLTVPEIVAAVAAARGLGPIQQQLSGTYAAREYCVQYNESDDDFVHRLLEEEGISYYFLHAAGTHTLTLSDDLTTVGAAAGYEDVSFQPIPTLAAGQSDHFRTWSSRRTSRTGMVTTRDYDFTQPRVDLTQQALAADAGFANAERYAYPGRYCIADVGAARAVVRLDATQAGIERVRAAGTVRGLQPGGTVTLSTHPRPEQNQDYIVLEAAHRIIPPWDAAARNDEHWYDGQYRLQPAANPVRPRARTPRPRVRGPQTAVVVGPQGEELYTDNYGRIKVQFHWDRVGADDEKSSCWIRCVQSLAGKGWGAFALPRIGQEVVVEFLEGDPDRPLVTGTVYNADMTGPLTLPDQAPCTSLKTKTIGAESPDQGHELTFDDTANAELIRLHSERDFERTVENNDTVKVGFDKQSPGDQTVSIFNNQTLAIGDDSAGDGSQNVTIKNNRNVTLNQGTDSLTITQGDWTVSLSAGSAAISAGQQIVLKVGGSQLTLDASGITLKGTTVEIDADGSFTAKGAEIQEEASASMTLKGGVVQIN